MKKIFSLFFAAVVAVIFSACTAKTTIDLPAQNSVKSGILGRNISLSVSDLRDDKITIGVLKNSDGDITSRISTNPQLEAWMKNAITAELAKRNIAVIDEIYTPDFIVNVNIDKFQSEIFGIGTKNMHANSQITIIANFGDRSVKKTLNEPVISFAPLPTLKSLEPFVIETLSELASRCAAEIASIN